MSPEHMTPPGPGGRVIPFSGFPNMMGNLINTLQRDGWTDRHIHYVANACRDHESLVARADLAGRMAEELREVLGLQIGSRWAKIKEVLAEWDQLPKGER